MEFATHGDTGASKAPPYVASHETHSGVVVLAGDRAYKAKKPAESVRRVEGLAAAYLAGRADLCAQRIDEGCIVDGHADLLADDIFWTDNRPVLLDCLEFSDDLRFVDRIDAAAFLAMDLEFLGRQDLGDYLLDRYAALSGDTAPSSLRDFYIAYRATVREARELWRAAIRPQG